MNPEPSVEWSEQISPEEHARHEELAAKLTAVQRSTNRRSGPGRALHRKQILGLRGTLAVLPDLPDYAKHGIFAQPGTYESLIRLSNGSPKVQRDTIPDVRGFALSVRGVSGPGSLGTQTDRQDFLLINRDNFGFATSEDFGKLLDATLSPGRGITDALRGGTDALRNAKMLAKVGLDLAKPFRGFAATTFHSAAPICVGPYAARIRLEPVEPIGGYGSALNLTDTMTNIVKDVALEYQLTLSFYTDERTTPIEDASRSWPTSACPQVRVATVTIPQQNPASRGGRELQHNIESAKFDPWASLIEHRPLGEVMRARKVAYYASQRNRETHG